MKKSAIEVSQKFWSALEKADADTMRSMADTNCRFVHIGGNCNLDEEMKAFTDGVFQPTEIVLNRQEAEVYGGTAVVITDCNYGLLLDGKPTTHHFSVTEVYQKQGEELKLIQFTFTALVY